MIAKHYIYRNLRTGGFSVRHKGIVIERIEYGMAADVLFKVNEKGRQRVINEKQKNVHAFAIVDEYAKTSTTLDVDTLPVITYNPYVSNKFTCNGEPIEFASSVIFRNGKCYLAD